MDDDAPRSHSVRVQNQTQFKSVVQPECCPTTSSKTDTRDGPPHKKRKLDETLNEETEKKKNTSQRSLKKNDKSSERSASRKSGECRPVRLSSAAQLDLILNETEYVIHKGFRHVVPYPFEYRAFAKGRWFGRGIFEVFSTEFEAYDADYYKAAIEDGRIKVRGKKVPLDYELCNGDWVSHTTHRHEPPILDAEIDVILENDDILVINKPTSIPIHPCGKYRHNSLIYILTKKYKKQFYTINRLDRLTSGVLILTKRSELASLYSKQIRERNVHKVYLARVKGKFSEKEVTVDAPIICLEHKKGKYGVSDKGKESKTTFRRLSYNGDTSVVECKPLTGRTHQIRVHLRHIGFPIANDPCYGGELIETRKPNEEGDSPVKSAMARASRDDCQECRALRSESPPSKDYNYGIWLHALRYSGDSWTYEVPWPEWAQAEFPTDLCS
eukprot:948543_1